MVLRNADKELRNADKPVGNLSYICTQDGVLLT